MKLTLFLMPAIAATMVYIQTSGEQTEKPDKAATVRDVKQAAENVADEPVADDPVDKDEAQLSRFMRQKLKASNRIMEGLCVDDLKLVESGAEILQKMSHAEQWRASNDVMYQNHSREFRERVKGLREKAQAENPDGAALAWLEVTMSCLHCHKWVRDSMLVDVGTGLNVPQPGQRP